MESSHSDTRHPGHEPMNGTPTLEKAQTDRTTGELPTSSTSGASGEAICGLPLQEVLNMLGENSAQGDHQTWGIRRGAGVLWALLPFTPLHSHPPHLVHLVTQADSP